MRFTTKKGYGFFEATSTFQKAIRRGDENLAMYFAVEFFNSGYDEYLWKRIKIIATEDIGLAAPQLQTLIAALYSHYSEQKKEKKERRPERLFLTHAVIQCCRAKKSRLIDYVTMSYWRTHDEKNVEIPEWALDKHTQKGKAMGRGIDHFFNEGCKLENHSVQFDEQKYRDEAYKVMKKGGAPLNFNVIIPKKGKSDMFSSNGAEATTEEEDPE